ncbi:MAG: 4-(cytidine 5'-diphospho)-2-C-methyl-D-erythritol kinase, partial [Gammaproteobacteria bacterium]
SNAATTLIMLNKLWDLQLSTAKLAEIGLTLGADVPVFVWHASRSQQGEGWWAEGIGEQLQPIALPECWYVVITPPCAVSTQKIFSHSELTRATPPITIGAFLKGDVHNDCEPLVCKLYPEIARVINWLNQFSPTGRARLTGTGSSVFSAFDSETAARACLAQILPAWRGFVATSLR